MGMPNVLADRYATEEMVQLFDPTNRIIVEREFWLAVLEAQIDLVGIAPRTVLDDYRSVLHTVDLNSIRDRDRAVRHDVKARIDEFNALAGHEHIHKGLTSRDLTENVEQAITLQALKLVESRTVALLARIAERSAEYAAVAMAGRTHNVAAQPTTVGKRLAMFGAELLLAYRRLLDLLERQQLRGLKGAVGSQSDLLALLGSAENVKTLEQRVAQGLGFQDTLDVVGQVYPRSIDYEVVATLLQLASGPANLALAIRLMAGHDLATEGFQEGQVGSSAMPHKMNTRSSERIGGFHTILKGHLTMAAGLTGDQWNEGDVSCSVVRRVLIPDAFFAIDGLYETAFSVVADFGVFPAVVSQELERYLPFLSTTALLMHAVNQGIGREQGHHIIRQHALSAAASMREGQGDGQALLIALGNDEQFPGDYEDLLAISANAIETIGTISEQIGSFCSEVATIAAGRTDATYGGRFVI